MTITSITATFKSAEGVLLPRGSPIPLPTSWTLISTRTGLLITSSGPMCPRSLRGTMFLSSLLRSRWLTTMPSKCELGFQYMHFLINHLFSTDYGFPAPLTQVQVSDGGVSSPNLRRKRHWEFLLSSLNSIAATLGWKRIGMLSTTIFIMVIALIWKSFLRSRTLTPSVPTPSPGEGSSVVRSFCAEFMVLKLDVDH